MTHLTRRDMMRGTVAASAAAAVATPALAQGPAPTDWIDPKTGHRIIRLSGDEGGSKAYFYRPIFSPQGDVMAMATPRGIVLVDMKTHRRRLLVADPRAELLFTGRRTRTVYYSIVADGPGLPTERATTVHAADMDSGRTRQVVRVAQGKVWSLNADETMLVCTVAEGEKPLQPDVPDPRNRRFGQAEYAAVGPDGRPLNFAKAKGVRMLQRWAARVPMELFVVNVRTGQRHVLLRSTDWLNHAQFSPTDPGQIIFSHEGPWHRVTRMWRIRADGGEPMPLHRRTMNMEIWGHEFFSPDGKWVWYDLQTPRGQIFWVAGVELATGRRIWRRVEQNDWSVHFNVSPDQKLFAGDGGDRDMVAHAPDGKWIVLLKPEPSVDADLDVYDPELIVPEYLRGERLVDMGAHDYRLEPNLTFTPDNRWIVFGSNIHGRNHVYMVEVAKAGIR